MLKSLSTALILRGIIALGLGIMALAWPRVTVLVLVILFAVYAFIAAGAQAILIFSTGGPVFGYLLGLADLTAGVIVLAWPGPTARVLVLIVGCWAIFVGLFEVFVAFRTGELAGSRALFVLSGLGAVAFGASLFARPAIGAVTISLLFGLFSLTNGASMVMQGIGLRRPPKTPHSVVAAERAHGLAQQPDPTEPHDRAGEQSSHAPGDSPGPDAG